MAFLDSVKRDKIA